jgi:hypothetical protein
MRSISISARRLLQRLTEMHLGLLPGWDGNSPTAIHCLGCHSEASDDVSLITGRRDGLCRACAESAALALAGPLSTPLPSHAACAFCAARARSGRRFHVWPDGTICESCIGLSLQIFAAERSPAERHWLT